jgi:ComEC/Rec2-related protein
MRYILSGACIFFLILLVFLLLRNILKVRRGLEVGSKKGPVGMKLFVHLFFVFLIVLISYLKASTLLQEIEETNEKALSFTERRISFEGYLNDEVDRKRRYQHLNVKLLQDLVVDGEILNMNHGYILVKTENYENFTIGQVCRFNGKLVEPENFEDFDYKTYLNNRRIFLILEDTNYFCFDTERRRGGLVIKNNLIDMKDGFIKKIDTALVEPYSSLLAGILFGKRRLFEPDFDSSIRVSGVSHVISASGYNITIVVLIVNKLTFFLPKKVKLLLGFTAIWMFAIFSGLSSSITRACIMNTLSLLAMFWGRSNTIHISLPFASAIFVFFSPLILFDVGFLLSISATLGLIYILPILTALKKKITKNLKFAEGYLFPTMSCTLSTLPVSLLTFKTFSIWAIPVNALILPVMEGVMLWGGLSVFLFNIHRPLSYFFFTVVNLQLKYFQIIVEGVHKLDFGVWEILNSYEVFIAPILFVMLFLLVIYYYPVENEKYNYYLKDR